LTIRGIRAVMTDDLSAPLGQRKPARRTRKLTFAELHAVAGALGLSTVFLTGWMFLADKPVGKAPLAAAQTQRPDSHATPAIDADLRVIRLSPDDRPNVVRVEAAPRSRTITITDGTSGRSQEIQIPISADDAVETSSVEPAPVVEPRKPAPPPRPSTNNSRSSDPDARAPRRTAGKPDAAVRVRASGD
jgi:hypothetical protein